MMEPLRILANTSIGGRPLTLILRGIGAVGARVRVEFKKAKPHITEVYGGSGYLTGSATTLYLGVPDGDGVEAIYVRKTGEEEEFPPPQDEVEVLEL